MTGPRPSAADVEILAGATAGELRFDARPEVRTSFPGTGRRESGQVTTREGIDTPVEPGRPYRRVSVSTRIASRLVDAAPGEAGGAAGR